jgi:hypothetical protein
MFESRLQASQFVLAVAGLFAVAAIGCFMAESVLVGVTCLVLEHAVAAVGCALFADSKNYPARIGVPIGVGLGVMGALAVAVLPDQTRENRFARHEWLASEGIKNARQRDPGYEVLDDDEDD